MYQTIEHHRVLKTKELTSDQNVRLTKGKESQIVMGIDTIPSYIHSGGQLGFPGLQVMPYDRRQAVFIYADAAVAA